MTMWLWLHNVPGIVQVIQGCICCVEAILAAVSFVSSVAIISSLGDDNFYVAVLTFGAFVLGAISMAFMATMFVFILDALSHHFFFWACFPCPGPGILSVVDNKKS